MTAQATPARPDSEGLGWTGRVMQWLRVATALVVVNVLFLVGALAGLVVLGLMPAAVAAAAVLRRNDLILGTAEHGLVRTFWGEYRRQFRRANLAGIPFGIAAVLLTADVLLLPQLTGPFSAVLLVLTAALVVAFVLTVLAAVALLSRYDDPVAPVLRYALVLPPTSPMQSLGVLIVVVAWSVLVSALPVLLPLLGVAIPLAIAVRLLDARLDLIEDAD